MPAGQGAPRSQKKPENKPVLQYKIFFRFFQPLRFSQCRFLIRSGIFSVGKQKEVSFNPKGNSPHYWTFSFSWHPDLPGLRNLEGLNPKCPVVWACTLRRFAKIADRKTPVRSTFLGMKFCKLKIIRFLANFKFKKIYQASTKCFKLSVAQPIFVEKRNDHGKQRGNSHL